MIPHPPSPAPVRPRRAAAPTAGSPRWVPIRTLGHGERALALSHLLALNDRDRALRFGYRASDAQIDHYVGQIDLAHDAMFGVFNRDLRLVAIAHLAFATGGRTAEFGVSVLERWRARGIGARLFKHAVMHARNRGAASLVIYMARHNAAMIGIVRRWGARISFEGAEGTAELPLRTDTMRSRIEQLLEQHAAEMDYRFKQQALRRDRVLRT